LKENNGSICYYHEIQGGSSDARLLPPMVKFLLVEGLRHGDEQAALNALDGIAVCMDSAASASQSGFLILDLLHLLVEKAEELGFGLPEEQLSPLLTYNGAFRFREIFTPVIRGLCKAYRRKASDADEKTRKKVLSFINQNFRSLSFSLDYTADSLKLPKSKICAVIKDLFGCSFAQYTASLRMEEVKRRLVETDESIREIIKNVGYLGFSNFERKFREEEGLTPGQYRLANCKKKGGLEDA
jgi:AraC-like DNA-binding protein